ncbi:citrate synthase [Deinococcus metallilatus]|uniref:Citrate synthase n=1 Tax=Deinococcus metallilatus TaxID=1211322 RepID=A0AAJ5F3N1_9DEIO|nr:citrate/2-methylcitrate synthase [Deinococcus metallilatus]MBB5295878.1 citrate synthase [Deinococcus metallilatus]QBY08283.1 citrate synthase [Deinococcus metallilatus]RXJ12014.1 citrate synthase [Deinococcus metallilatus]TLK25754.1 citrate synthase [Deinococcus metallilatus]GMA14588.1 citrate synthase [Deinococcus metallilatus]
MTDIAKGLEGVLFTETKLTFINGSEGILTHLGIPIQEWAENSSFEELSLALLDGELPTAEELAKFDADLKANRAVPQQLLDVITAMPRGIHPMQALRTAVSYLGLLDPQAEDISEAGRRAISIRLIAQFATVIAAIARAQEGQEPVAPRMDLTHAGNFLYMLTGKEPTAEQARLFDIALVLHADHGMNASTFTAIATASTLSDMYSCMTSAIGALKGPLHGGANEAVMDMLDEVGTPDRAEAYITKKLDNKEKIMGVGHRVYKYFDPRSRVLRDYAEHVANKEGKSTYYQILETIEKLVVDRMGAKGIYPNVDFYSGTVYSDLGIKKEYFTPIFALARVSGWCASVIEYTRDNRLLRPDALYTGKVNQHYVPLKDRR